MDRPEERGLKLIHHSPIRAPLFLSFDGSPRGEGIETTRYHPAVASTRSPRSMDRPEERGLKLDHPDAVNPVDDFMFDGSPRGEGIETPAAPRGSGQASRRSMDRPEERGLKHELRVALVHGASSWFDGSPRGEGIETEERLGRVDHVEEVRWIAPRRGD